MLSAGYAALFDIRSIPVTFPFNSYVSCTLCLLDGIPPPDTHVLPALSSLLLLELVLLSNTLALTSSLIRLRCLSLMARHVR